MTFCEKCVAVQNAKAEMESSKMLNLDAAVYYAQIGNQELANAKLEKAAQYAFGFARPKGW